MVVGALPIPFDAQTDRHHPAERVSQVTCSLQNRISPLQIGTNKHLRHWDHKGCLGFGISLPMPYGVKLR